MANPVERNELGMREPALDVLGFAVVDGACKAGLAQVRLDDKAHTRTKTHDRQCRAGSGLAESKGRPAAFSGHRNPQSEKRPKTGSACAFPFVSTEREAYHADLVLCGNKRG